MHLLRTPEVKARIEAMEEQLKSEQKHLADLQAHGHQLLDTKRQERRVRRLQAELEELKYGSAGAERQNA
jgi:hypothetical protein